jgi:transcriptional regulator GlxA family with amidase domain
MTKPSSAPVQDRFSHKRRRIIVVVVPPVDELDLVGPLQVFSSVNRLASRSIYSIELVTNARQLQVHGEGGLLSLPLEVIFRT